MSGKKLVARWAAGLAGLALSCSTFGQIVTVGDASYTTNNWGTTNTCTLVDWNVTGPDITVAAFYDGLRVSDVGPNCFQGETTPTNISFQSSLFTIGDYAFADMPNLERIVFWNGLYADDWAVLTNLGVNVCANSPSLTAFGPLGTYLNEIPDDAFNGCSSLTNLLLRPYDEVTYASTSPSNFWYELPNPGISAIGDRAFKDSGLVSYFDAQAEDIGLFDPDNPANPLPLVSVEYRWNSLEDIGPFAFDGVALTSLEVPGTLTNIGVSALSDLAATNVSLGTFPAGLTFSGAGYLEAVDLTFSNAVSIPASFFSGCTNLESVTVSGGGYIGTLGISSLDGCTNLTTVDLSQAVQLGAYALRDCSALADVTFLSITNVGDDVIDGCTSLTSLVLRLPEVYVSSSFEDSGVVDLTITNGTAYPSLAGFTTATNLTLPDTITNFVPGALAPLTALQSLVASNSTAVVVPTDAFDGCFALETVYLPQGVTNISAYAVTEDNTNLASFVLAPGGSAYCAEGGVLYSYLDSSLVRVPPAYEDPDKDFDTVAPIPELPELYRIDARAFAFQQSITNVNIYGGVEYIGEEPFIDSTINSVNLIGNDYFESFPEYRLIVPKEALFYY